MVTCNWLPLILAIINSSSATSASCNIHVYFFLKGMMVWGGEVRYEGMGCGYGGCGVRYKGGECGMSVWGRECGYRVWGIECGVWSVGC